MTNNNRYRSDYDFDRNNSRENSKRAERYDAGYDGRSADNEEYVDIYNTQRDRIPYYAKREYYGRNAADHRKSSTAGIVIATVSAALAAVIAASALALGAFAVKPINGNTDPTISIAASVDKDANRNAQNTAQADEQTASKNDNDQADRIDTINGERVYIDTKRPAPDHSGTPAHFYANGKTSYGFDWNYDADNSNFVIRCDYNFDEQQYDFQFYGTAPGTAHITVCYNTDDNTQVPVNLTLNVDDSLNASIA